MKQTAVEWLVYVVQSNIAPNYIPKEIVKQAKEIEKIQIIDACKYGNNFEQGDLNCENYYNKTYKNINK
jgi:hypothetical protein